MYPLTFLEFLLTQNNAQAQYALSIDHIEPLPQIFFDKLREEFTTYCICGGMPEAALTMVQDKDLQKTDKVLSNILNDYSLDFVKHTSSALTPRITHVWNSLPSQLAKENRKFLYQLVRSGARAREYEDAILWLEQAGLVNKVVLSKTPRLPLNAYDNLSSFKLYALDHGLLRQLSNLDASVFLQKTATFTEYKGALTENLVLQSLTALYQNKFRYWASDYRAEVDFLLQHGNNILPIEVKSDTNTQGKSLMQYQKQFTPELRLRYSMLNLKKDDNLLNIPFFLSDRTKDFLEM